MSTKKNTKKSPIISHADAWAGAIAIPQASSSSRGGNGELKIFATGTDDGKYPTRGSASFVEAVSKACKKMAVSLAEIACEMVFLPGDEFLGQFLFVLKKKGTQKCRVYSPKGAYSKNLQLGRMQFGEIGCPCPDGRGLEFSLLPATDDYLVSHDAYAGWIGRISALKKGKITTHSFPLDTPFLGMPEEAMAEEAMAEEAK